MLDMSCPSCGAGGRVPRNKVNARLICKKCLRVFYLTPSGKAVLGEPPAPKQGPAERGPRERVELDAGEFFDDLGSKLSKIRLPQPRTLAIIAAVVLVAAGIAWLLGRQSVETRSQAVATAIGKGDVQTIMDLVMPGTEMEAIKWSADLNKQYTDLKVSLGGGDPGVKVSVQGDSRGSTAQSLVVFSREGAKSTGPIPIELLQPVPNLSNSKQSIEMVLFWGLDGWGNWRLDGKKTSEAMSPPM